MNTRNTNEGGGVEYQQQQQQQKKRKEEETPLMALNHVSRLCRSVDKSRDFYKGMLGFVEMERPDSLDFNGAWLFNYGVGVHLVQARDEDRLPPLDEASQLDPMDNHISFQCEDMEAIERKLMDRNIKYMKTTLGDDSQSKIDQLFFTDPDGFMIEICNCENLRLIPQGSLGEVIGGDDRI
ncbi:uncharacterized protein LOC116194997 isoform X2 [Punica granatum]|uniref:Uncharacterized protein LOC116194997 isoform X2 n=1 Tax=Punica granatum TaxID=22663 RepID=A0A6P8CE91_PUNGR|nr:uncharacterized protein LOC116194997 isoform X2 [Punica granatum]